MPYITEKDREGLLYENPISEGQLNYVLTQVVDTYITEHGLNYRSLNAAVGALECCKLELYRRIASVYEDRKITENGDVYQSAKLLGDQ